MSVPVPHAIVVDNGGLGRSLLAGLVVEAARLDARKKIAPGSRCFDYDKFLRTADFRLGISEPAPQAEEICRDAARDGLPGLALSSPLDLDFSWTPTPIGSNKQPKKRSGKLRVLAPTGDLAAPGAEPPSFKADNPVDMTLIVPVTDSSPMPQATADALTSYCIALLSREDLKRLTIILCEDLRALRRPLNEFGVMPGKDPLELVLDEDAFRMKSPREPLQSLKQRNEVWVGRAAEAVPGAQPPQVNVLVAAPRGLDLQVGDEMQTDWVQTGDPAGPYSGLKLRASLAGDPLQRRITGGPLDPRIIDLVRRRWRPTLCLMPFLAAAFPSKLTPNVELHPALT